MVMMMMKMMMVMMMMMNCFCGMVDLWKALRVKGLFPARTTVKDSQHRRSPTRHDQDLNLRRTRVQTLLNEVMWEWEMHCLWTTFEMTFIYSWNSGGVYYVCLKSKMLCICRFSSSSSLRLFRNIGEFGAKKYFTDNQTADTIKLFVFIKGNFSGLFFWEYLINVTTCVFASH